MINSKGWEWEKVEKSPWLEPTEDAYYFAHRWSELGFKRILDLGSGLGRHSIFFAQHGFDVCAIDLSEYGINNLKEWAKKENFNIDAKVGNMGSLPYEDNYFDCIFAYHTIPHTDTKGMKNTISEIERVLKPNGEIYTSMCSKESWEFSKSNFPKIDENSLLIKEAGQEDYIPHFFVNRDDILELFHNFDIKKIKHVDYCYLNHKECDCKNYYVWARMK